MYLFRVVTNIPKMQKVGPGTKLKSARIRSVYFLILFHATLCLRVHFNNFSVLYGIEWDSLIEEKKQRRELAKVQRRSNRKQPTPKRLLHSKGKPQIDSPI